MSDPAALSRIGVRTSASGPDIRRVRLTCRGRHHATRSVWKSRCSDARGRLDATRSWKEIGQTKSTWARTGLRKHTCSHLRGRQCLVPTSSGPFLYPRSYRHLVGNHSWQLPRRVRIRLPQEVELTSAEDIGPRRPAETRPTRSSCRSE